MRLIQDFETRAMNIDEVFSPDVFIGEVKSGTAVGFLLHDPGEQNTAVRVRFQHDDADVVSVNVCVEGSGATASRSIPSSVLASDALDAAKDMVWDVLLG